MIGAFNVWYYVYTNITYADGSPFDDRLIALLWLYYYVVSFYSNHLSVL